MSKRKETFSGRSEDMRFEAQYLYTLTFLEEVPVGLHYIETRLFTSRERSGNDLISSMEIYDEISPSFC